MARCHESLIGITTSSHPHNGFYRVTGWWIPAALSLAVLFCIIVMPLVTLISQFAALDGLAVLSQSYTWRVVRFSLFQAVLSTLLSLALAVPMAVALSRETSFFGRRTLLRLFSIPLVMPTLVAITGLIVVFGHRGWLTGILSLINLDGGYRFYGLGGILLAHVFFNFPLATRVLLQSLDNIPAENWRLAGQFGMSGKQQFRWIEFPALWRAIPGISLLVFSLCFTSFAVVLTLGGGPAATTIEVAIYQALRLEFDIPASVVLALLQIVICGGLLLATTLIGKPATLSGSQNTAARRYLAGRRIFNFLIIIPGFLLVASPLFAVVIRGINSKTLAVITDTSLWQATILTATLGIASGILAVLLACGILLGSRHLRVRLNHETAGKLLASSGLVTLVMPNVVLSAGLFLWLYQKIDVFGHAAWLVVAVNALVGLPFATAILGDAFMTMAERNDKLCAALNIRGLNRLRWIDWPMIRQPLGLALGMCSAMAAGDLTSIALFGSQNFQTLPLLLYQWLGAYRMGEASVAAMLLLLLGLGLYLLFERGLRAPFHA